MSNTIPQDRIQIFDHDGKALAEFRAYAPRSWAIGKMGIASMKLSVRDTDIVDSDILRPGNWLLIENDSVPDWVGVIDLPRTWGERVVDVNAFTPEKVFELRRGPSEIKLTGSAGTIFESLLAYVNLPEATILRAGDIWRGGAQRDETINPTPLSKNLARIQSRSKEEYAWRPVVDSSLMVFCDWSEQLGEDTSCQLVEGQGGGNIQSGGSIMVEDVPLFNDVLTYGDGQTWASKPLGIAKDNDSNDTYGLRQTSISNYGVKSPAALTANASRYLQSSKQPTKRLSITALNNGDTFDYMRLGNTVELIMQSVGFAGNGIGYTGTVRILGMGYNPQNGYKLELIVEEVL